MGLKREYGPFPCSKCQKNEQEALT
jgi:hypothetical protein